MAVRCDERIYVQVCRQLPEESDREVANLLEVKDHYPKYVVTLDDLARRQCQRREDRAFSGLPAQFGLLKPNCVAECRGSPIRPPHNPSLSSTSAHSREVYPHSTLLNVLMASSRWV